MSKTGQFDRLEEAWRELGAAIRRREKELASLKEEFRILDQARAVLMLREGAGGESPVLFSPAKKQIGLKEAIVESIAGSEFGLELAELLSAIRTKIDDTKYSSERSFIAAIQTTVRRMIISGELALTAHNAIQRYIVGPKAGRYDGQGMSSNDELE